MRLLCSPRGAKRGLLLAGLAALLWLSWAAGFTLGRAQTFAATATATLLHLSPTNIDRRYSEPDASRIVARSAKIL